MEHRGRVRRAAVGGPRGLPGHRGLYRRAALGREGDHAVGRHVRGRRAGGGARHADRLPRLSLRAARLLLRPAHRRLRRDLSHHRLQHRHHRRRRRLLHHVHRRPAPVPVPGRARVLLRRAGAHAGRDGRRRVARAPAVRRLSHRHPRGRERERGARRRYLPLQAAGDDAVVVPHRRRGRLLRVLSVLAAARVGVRYPAVRRDHHAGHRGRRRHRPRAHPRLVHPEPARRAGPSLLRSERLARRPSRRVRAPADRRRALPA